MLSPFTKCKDLQRPRRLVELLSCVLEGIEFEDMSFCVGMDF